MSTFEEQSQKWGEMRVFEDPWEPWKMNQATHLPISNVSHIKKYETDNIFWKNINSYRIFQVLQKEC